MAHAVPAYMVVTPPPPVPGRMKQFDDDWKYESKVSYVTITIQNEAFICDWTAENKGIITT